MRFWLLIASVNLLPLAAAAEDWGDWGIESPGLGSVDIEEQDFDYEQQREQERAHRIDQVRVDESPENSEELEDEFHEQARERHEQDFGVGLEGDDERYLSQLDGSSLDDEFDHDHDGPFGRDYDDHDDDREHHRGGDHNEYWESLEAPFVAFENDYGEDLDDEFDRFREGGGFDPGEFFDEFDDDDDAGSTSSPKPGFRSVSFQ